VEQHRSLVLVARDSEQTPRAVGVIAGGDRADVQTLLALLGLDAPDVGSPEWA
jgi:hypothetical protein